MMRLDMGANRWRAVTAISMTTAAVIVSLAFAVMAMLIVNHD